MGEALFYALAGYVVADMVTAVFKAFRERADKERARQKYEDWSLANLFFHIPSRDLSPNYHVEFTQRLNKILKLEALKEVVELMEAPPAYPYSSVGYRPIMHEDVTNKKGEVC